MHTFMHDAARSFRSARTALKAFSEHSPALPTSRSMVTTLRIVMHDHEWLPVISEWRAPARAIECVLSRDTAIIRAWGDMDIV